MNRKKINRKVQRKLFVGFGYPLLVLAAFCTMVPLLWLLSSSFKSAEEVFAVPIQWFPKLPDRVSASPYIKSDSYLDVKMPELVAAEKWEQLRPALEDVIWQQAQGHISDSLPTNSPELEQALQHEIVKGLWQQHVASLPPEVWRESTETIVNQVESTIIPETIKPIFDSVYRQVKIGSIVIEDISFKKHNVDTVYRYSDFDTILHFGESITSLSCGFEKNNEASLSATVSSPVSIDRIRRVIIPIQGDASYHRLSLTVSKGTTVYKSKHPFVLDTALWKDSDWRLHGIPGELESSHIPMQQFYAKKALIKSVVPPPETEDSILLQITIHRPAYLSIVWHKLTANYKNLWEAVPYNRYFINSVFIATASTLLTLFFCSLGGYAFAKYQFKGKAILFGILLASMMIPFQVLLVPLFGLMYDIGWLNSYKAIIIPFSVGAFGIFLMRQFIVTIPSELIDAARIDGCSEFGIYYRIVLPIIKPALGALTIYSFLSSWNGYLWPLIVLRDEAKYTLPIGLANLIGIYRQDYGMLMAGTFLSLLPIIVLFLAMQREFVQGITLGSVKE